MAVLSREIERSENANCSFQAIIRLSRNKPRVRDRLRTRERLGTRFLTYNKNRVEYNEIGERKVIARDISRENLIFNFLIESEHLFRNLGQNSIKNQTQK